MRNTAIPFTTDNNPLLQRVAFENSVVAEPIEGTVQVQLASDGKTVQFTHKGKILHAVVERPLIHQLGGRIWGQDKSFEQIEDLWQSTFKQNRIQLEQEVAAQFRKHDLVTRYYADSRGDLHLYGIVTPYFIEVNPLDFRSEFLEQVQKNSLLHPQSYGIQQLDNNTVVESFRFEAGEFQTEYRYGLIYAKNNGYDAFSVKWGRMVLVCSNGLKEWQGSKLRWKHTSKITIADFLNQSITEGVNHQSWLEQRICSARSKQLQSDSVNELLQRLSLASASKMRVMDRIGVEANTVGHNEWALSQALTWLGSHERYISYWGKRQMTGLGTDLLENSLDKVLSEESKLYQDGSYGLLLPKHFQKQAA